jgi:hypothetical protein
MISSDGYNFSFTFYNLTIGECDKRGTKHFKLCGCEYSQTTNGKYFLQCLKMVEVEIT